MHCVSPALSRSSSAMRSSTRRVQPADSFAQSAAFRHAVVGQLRELDADFLERQADLLRKHDEGDAAEDRARIAAVAGPGPLATRSVRGLHRTAARRTPRRCGAPPR